MNDTINYIEAYFGNTLNAQERIQFEERITGDATFAKEVAFYIQTRQALHQQLVTEKSTTWQKEEQSIPTPTVVVPIVAIKKATPLKRWIAVAAILVVVLGAAFLVLENGKNTAQKLASEYLASPEIYSNTMDASQDSLQQGITALKSDSLDKAQAILSAYYAAHPKVLEALKYSGITALRQKNYAQAIALFDSLSGTEQYDNVGPFYKAITLLIRNEKNDKEQARALLNQVVDQKLGNQNKAKELLRQL